MNFAEDQIEGRQNRDFRMWALLAKSLVLSKMESFNEAEKVALTLKSVIEEGIKEKEIRLYYLVLGMIELERANLSEAVELLQDALSLLPAQSEASSDQALYIYPLASAYYANRDLDRAREEFTKITLLTLGREGYGNLYAKSFYMLGKIYEEQGNSLKAIEHYEKFLDLWKDADPGIAEVEDAMKRVAGLKSQ